MEAKKHQLEEWISRRIGQEANRLTRERLEQYQLEKLQETISWSITKSSFYRKLFENMDTEITSIDDLCKLPFTTADDLREKALQFLCVSQDEINRVVTLQTSGTTGQVKRLFFTAADLESTIDFFGQGMSILAEPGDRVLILLPGERPGNVGDLLATALTRNGITPVPHGIVSSISRTIEVIENKEINVIVGIPTQVLALARYASQVAQKSFRIKSVLLSTDYVPQSIVDEIKQLWSCDVFEHYGMTEMGFGGGIDCQAHEGYHLRSADFYWEIIDPDTLKPVPDGQLGEVVFTTLTRRGMPLIRYRTGDISRVLPQKCSCGAILRRLCRITNRKNGRIFLTQEQFFTLPELDEALFAIKNILTYSVSVDNRHQVKKLSILAVVADISRLGLIQEINKALDGVLVINWGRQTGILEIEVRAMPYSDDIFTGTAKRTVAEWSGDGN